MLDRRPIRGFPFPILLPAALAAAGCSPGTDPGSAEAHGSPSRVASSPNVVFVCLDTVRADHLGCYGYERDTTPFLDALAASGTRFADASSAASWTKPSVPSFLTGTFPCQHGVYEGSSRLRMGAVTDILPDEALTLAEVFQERGYRTAAFVHNAQLRPGNGFEQGFDEYHQENWDAREIRWRGTDWLDQEDGAGRPFFLYLHFLDAHWPYPAPDDYATLYATAEEVAPFRGRESKALRNALNDGETEFTPAYRKALAALYDGSLRYLDDNLRAFHDALELRGLLDDTVICIVSDHGEEFGEHGYIGHGNGLYENLLEVPWILSVPGRAPSVVERSVSLVDVFPTLLGAVGFTPPEGLAGVNRFAEPDAVTPIFAEHKGGGRYLQSLREDTEKIVREWTGPEELVHGISPIGKGERWQVEFETREDGTYRATELKPDGDDPDDPIELKGHVAKPEGESFFLGDIRIAFDSVTRRQRADGVRDDQLSEGRLVKVKGFFREGGMYAERIKFYARHEDNPLELRGRIEEIHETEGVGRLRIGELWFDFDRQTELKGDFEGPKRKRVLERSDIVALIEGGEQAAAALSVAVDARLHDLAADPEELGEGREAEPGRTALIDVLTRKLLPRRVFDESDSMLLTPEAIEELRAIGYAE